MQLDQARQQNQLSGHQRQLNVQAAAQAGQQRQLTGQQQQLHQAAAQRPQSWANAAAQPPSLAALAGRQPGASVAANLAANHPHNTSGSNDSDEWQNAVSSHGRHARRHDNSGGRLSGSAGNGSSVSSGSPRPTPPPSL